MAYTTKFGNYIKFVKGTPEQWAALTLEDKNKDTLYFICAANASTGELYLGNQLIAGGVGTGGANSVADLQDILLNQNIQGNSVLVYNAGTQKWEDKTIVEALQSAGVDVMAAASAENDGTSGLVPVPTKGSQNLFLRGDATWADPTTELRATVATLIGEDVGKSVAEIISAEVAKLVTGSGDPNTIDTIKDIVDWIDNHEDANQSAILIATVQNLDKVINGVPEKTDEEGNVLTPVVPGLLSKVEALDFAMNNAEGKVEILSGTVATLEEAVESIQEYLEEYGDDITDIKTLKQLLTWRIMDTVDSTN